MVALTLSVLALSGGIAAGEPMTQAPMLGALPSSLVACETAVASSDVSMIRLTGAQLRGDQKEPSWINDVSLSINETPREPMDLGSPDSMADTFQPLELQLAAPTKYFDVTLARRTLSSEYRGAYVTGQGAEVRIGQGLALLQSSGNSAERTGWYLFAASDGRQLSWTPTSDPSTPTRSLRLDNGVEIGEMQVGLATQHGALQTSLSLVKRTVKSYWGPFKTSTDGSFAGVTLSYRH